MLVIINLNKIWELVYAVPPATFICHFYVHCSCFPVLWHPGYTACREPDTVGLPGETESWEVQRPWFCFWTYNHKQEVTASRSQKAASFFCLQEGLIWAPSDKVAQWFAAPESILCPLYTLICFLTVLHPCLSVAVFLKKKKNYSLIILNSLTIHNLMGLWCN